MGPLYLEDITDKTTNALLLAQATDGVLNSPLDVFARGLGMSHALLPDVVYGSLGLILLRKKNTIAVKEGLTFMYI